MYIYVHICEYEDIMYIRRDLSLEERPQRVDPQRPELDEYMFRSQIRGSRH